MSRDLMLLHPTLIWRVQRLIHHPGRRVTSMVSSGSAASPPTTSTSSSTRAEPERLAIRTVSPRRSGASRVARPIAPVPK
jgi:hypothetical protein